MNNLRKELNNLEYEMGFMELIQCNSTEIMEFKKLKKDKQDLPEDVMRKVCIDEDGEVTEAQYFRFCKTNHDLTEDEMIKLITYRKNNDELSCLRSIKNSMKFFVILTVISLSISIALMVIGLVTIN